MGCKKRPQTTNHSRGWSCWAPASDTWPVPPYLGLTPPFSHQESFPALDGHGSNLPLLEQTCKGFEAIHTNLLVVGTHSPVMVGSPGPPPGAEGREHPWPDGTPMGLAHHCHCLSLFPFHADSALTLQAQPPRHVGTKHSLHVFSVPCSIKSLKQRGTVNKQGRAAVNCGRGLR